MLRLFKQKFIGISLDPTVDQVTAMIFRRIEPYHFELLFLQRNYHAKDKFSGDLCFPGGHREAGENCIQTAIRETVEETGIRLTEKHYIGSLDYIFKTNPGFSKVEGVKKKHLDMGVILFCLDAEEKPEVSLCQKQIRDYKWVDFNRTFLRGSLASLQHWKVTRGGLNFQFPAYSVGMDRPLWGLTLSVTMYFLSRLKALVAENQSIKKQLILDQDLIERSLAHCGQLRVEGEANSEQERRAAMKFKEEYLNKRAQMLRPKL